MNLDSYIYKTAMNWSYQAYMNMQDKTKTHSE